MTVELSLDQNENLEFDLSSTNSLDLNLSDSQGNLSFSNDDVVVAVLGVTSVNGMDGDVILDIPSKTSDLENDSGFITNQVNDLVNYSKTSDFSNVAFSGSHPDLTNRDLENQHPISAITGLRSELDDKQDELVSGQNIKTINHQSIVGQGNIDVGGDVFQNDITLAGNWSQVGNLTKSQTGTKTYAAAGKTSVEVLTDILSQDANPTTTQPSGSISLAHSGNVEVGNTIAISVTTSFNPGSYTYDNTTGVTASSYAFTDTNSHSDTNNAGNTTFNNYSLLVEDGTNYTASVAISYTAGNIPHTQLGNEYPAGQIQAGTINKTSSAIKGVRYMFNGANTQVKTLNSTNIRALSGANPSNNFNITIPQNCVQVIIAFPKSLNKTLSKVEDVGAFGTDIKARFEKSTVSVEGASSYTAVDYDVWEYLPATTLDANTYRVTMS